MVTPDDVVVTLGPRYSPVQEFPGGVLRVQLGIPGTEPIEVRIEPDWVRLFAAIGPIPEDVGELHRLLRANEQFHHVRYGIEGDRVVLRADIPSRLWSASQLLEGLAEAERCLAGPLGPSP